MSDWTDKKIEKLKKLWEKGYSAAEIGKKLGFSKNAIVGKVHRLGLANRASPIKSSSGKPASDSKAVSKKPTEKLEKPAKIVSLKHSKAEPVSRPSAPKAAKPAGLKIASNMTKALGGISMLELTSDLCCWPIDDVNSENFHFCGKKVFRSKPYCLEHCAVAYTNSSTPAEEREADEGAALSAETEEE